MKRLVASLAAVSLFVAVSPAEVHGAGCDAASATKLPDSSSGRPIEFIGDDIGEQAMSSLWNLGQTWNTHDFGKAIAEDQNWFDECKYPGIGLGTGSGYSWRDRNVTLWIWADAVDITQARATIFNLVQPPPATTSTTTTTTIAEPTPQAFATVAALDPEPAPTPETTTTTTLPAPIAVAFATSVAAEKVVNVSPAKKIVVKKKVVKKKKKVISKIK